MSEHELELDAGCAQTDRIREFIFRPDSQFDTSCIPLGLVQIALNEYRRHELPRITLNLLEAAESLDRPEIHACCHKHDYHYQKIRKAVARGLNEALHRIVTNNNGDALAALLEQDVPSKRWNTLLTSASFCCTERLLQEGKTALAVGLFKFTDSYGRLSQKHNNRIADAFAVRFKVLLSGDDDPLYREVDQVTDELKKGNCIRSLLNLQAETKIGTWIYVGSAVEATLADCLEDNLRRGKLAALEEYFQEAQQDDCPWSSDLKKCLKRALNKVFSDLEERKDTACITRFLAGIVHTPLLAGFAASACSKNIMRLAAQVQRIGIEPEREILAKLTVDGKTPRPFTKVILKGLEAGAPELNGRQSIDNRFMMVVRLARFNL